MWIRVRPDIAWSDLLSGLWGTMFARNRHSTAKRLEMHWSNDSTTKAAPDGMACLSVRSALDLLLSALDLPKGSEVLYSAVTIPDMVHVARAHDLVPVPVDVEGADLRVNVDALRRAIGPQSRVLVVAHLFGALPDLREVLQVAKDAGLFVVEDCAQAWCGHEFRGDPHADASLFSFGAIKTATALGGALARIKDPALLARMRELQLQQPVESRRAFAKKVFKNYLMGLMATKPVFSTMVWLAQRRGLTVDGLITRLSKGFPGKDLMAQLRRQPCAAQLRLLHRRLRKYDLGRIQHRVNKARMIIEAQGLAETCPELTDSRHSFWLFPYQTAKPQALVKKLWTCGVDSARRGSLAVVPAPEGRPELACPSAKALLDSIVFLPCYPELPDEVIRRMCKAMREL